MTEFINQLDANFVLAVLLFLVFFCFGMAAAISDAILKRRNERANERYLKRYHEPIGRVTDYRVISNGYQPRGTVTGPLNPPTGGSGVQMDKDLRRPLQLRGKKANPARSGAGRKR